MHKPLTRDELLAFKAQGLHIFQIAALLGLKPGTVGGRARALKIRFCRAKPKHVRGVHPWAKHRVFAIYSPKQFEQIMRIEENRRRVRSA